MSLLLRAFLMWGVVAAAMFANGAFRVLVLEPRFGEQLARQLATGTGVLIVAGFAYLFVFRLKKASAGDLWKVGALWLLLTVAFEFGLGLATGASWDTMLADYNILSGRLWPLILLTALVAPPLWGLTKVGRSKRG